MPCPLPTLSPGSSRPAPGLPHPPTLTGVSSVPALLWAQVLDEIRPYLVGTGGGGLELVELDGPIAKVGDGSRVQCLGSRVQSQGYEVQLVDLDRPIDKMRGVRSEARRWRWRWGRDGSRRARGVGCGTSCCRALLRAVLAGRCGCMLVCHALQNICPCHMPP